AALQRLCWEATEAVLADVNVLILSDRAVAADRVPIPAALATGAVHHHLIRQGLRMQTGLVVETGEAREVHHFCVLAGYGAEAINPYLALETLAAAGVGESGRQAYVKAVGKGILKVMSKMGISTYQSYCGAQIFDAVGLSSALLDRYFTGTSSSIEGAGLEEIALEAVERHRRAFGRSSDILDLGGAYAFRIGGEDHAWTPETIADLQHSVRGNLPDKYRSFAAAINEQSRRLLTIRGLLALKPAGPPVPIDEVEPASAIVRRFSTGAMSFGSISREAHTTLAVAMNRIGGRSNTGEGGEERDRFRPLESGDSMRSSIKQVASGRFGVTTEYLVNADEIQIKMAQGAKPGEGGQLPGHKVDRHIAEVRHSTPGVGLISPPPHHDIYSIEDIAQLIHDLKNVNPSARVSVKLVSAVGVGTVAAGVAKAMADHVTISGYEGGTGASPLTSLTHAGLPWEIGLAETQQTLVLNGLRGRICVQADGGLRTGRDVAIAAILGADEFGFATAPLIAAGCIMMRKCHLNTCPVGIATQDPVLRARFDGEPEHVINYFFFVAEELREIMAALGVRTVDEMIGRPELVESAIPADHWKAGGVDLTALLHSPATDPGVARWNREQRTTGIEGALDSDLIEAAAPALEAGRPVVIEREVRNVDRSVGTMLSGQVAARYGHEGLPAGTIDIRLRGTAGQSFGAFLAHGVALDLVGDANDYVGKGLSGGRIAVRQPEEATRAAGDNIIVGNTVLYGAVAGEAYFNGVAGERFAVRNSGAVAVVEGAGDHACEYMTGGVVVVLGPVGRNFAAGMSGGIAYVYDPGGRLGAQCNRGGIELQPLSPEGWDGRADGAPLDRPVDVWDNGMGDMLRHDAQRLRILIERHERATSSVVARELLADWPKSVGDFIKVLPVEYRRALLDLESHVGNPVTIDRRDRDVPPPAERLRTWSEFVAPPSPQEVARQASRCMDCGIPFCHSGCPVNNLIPDWNDLVSEADWRAAIDRLHETNNFPEFTGRVCPAPCEAACTLNLTDAPVTIKSIECEIIDRAWREGWVRPQAPPRGTGRRIAIVGSGPAGLACAQQLARAGHAPTVFEKSDRIGGLLRYGIPDFKLDKSLIDRRIAQMEIEGVIFRPGLHVGVDVSVERLLDDYDVLVLAGGAELPRDLDVPGRELAGVHFAMDYLTQQNKRVAGDPEAKLATEGMISAEGLDVVVIGGGDTGSDCIGTANRQGARSVTQLEIMPQPPLRENKALTWPHWPLKLRTSSSQEEGCERDFSVVTTRLSGSSGRVEALECARVEWRIGSDGRPQMAVLEGSDFRIKADLVLLAMGFAGARNHAMLAQSGAGLTARGTVDAPF
ncbi:MAG: hypothetical protein M1823_006298, partial [Watsoniomyces obsoletus]